MTRRAAILGLGSRGAGWAQTCVAAGWDVGGFDPAADGLLAAFWPEGCRRERTISGAVRRADWIFVCLPERLELVQMVLQRAQAEAPDTAVLAVVSRHFDIEALQGCTIRPSQVFHLGEGVDQSVSLGVTERNPPELCESVMAVFAELAAVRSITGPTPGDDQEVGAESA